MTQKCLLPREILGENQGKNLKKTWRGELTQLFNTQGVYASSTDSYCVSFHYIPYIRSLLHLSLSSHLRGEFSFSKMQTVKKAFLTSKKRFKSDNTFIVLLMLVITLKTNDILLSCELSKTNHRCF